MEQTLPGVAKKFWKMVRVLCFMVKKGLSKARLMADLSLMKTLNKVAGKFTMHHHSADSGVSQILAGEYEFSCNDIPAHCTLNLPFHIHKQKSQALPSDQDLLAAAMEFVDGSAQALLELPGFGQTPMVRQLRITDSPFLITKIEEDADVDEATEEFIMKFYREF